MPTPGGPFALIASEGASHPLTILLLGPMQVLVHGRPLPHMRSRKAFWLLALLSLRDGRPVDREWLAGTLWPDVTQERSATNLRVVLSELRRALGSEGRRLQSPGRHTLALDLTGADVDLRTFDAAINSKKLEALKQAVALYRGPLLEDCAEEWVGQERSVREQDCLLALQTLADAALATGSYDAAAAYCRRARGMDPWGEATLRRLMEALAKSGDRNAALHVYRQHAEFLRSDPRAVPDEETSALYTRLRAEARQGSRTPAASTAEPAVLKAAATLRVSSYLPHPLTDLIGREQERFEVAAQLRGSRLVSLTGPGGIGKTRLAIEVAAEGAQDGATYPDGVWLVALESLSAGQQVVPQIAAVMGIREEPGRSLLERVSDYLRTKRQLLVLDSCEHLLDVSAHVARHLLQECAQVRILATSREALGIMGEAVFPVPSLAAPDPKHFPTGSATPLQVIAEYESIQLFVERAQERQKGFALTQRNAMAVAQVCFQLGGIPLAIEFAAARVSAMTVEQIAARLNDHLSLLTGGSRTAPPRQKTLRATLDWSYALLSVAQQALLARLSVFAGGATLPAVETVCSGAGIEQKQVLDLLTSLVEKSLVIFETTPAEGRYRLLDTVQQYAAERLDRVEGEAAMQEKHLAWFLAFAEEAEPHLRGPELETYLRRLDDEYGNLRVALARSAAGMGKAEEGLRLAGALWWFWRTHGRFREGVQYLEAALAREGAQEATAARAKALNVAGDLANRQGDYKSARALNEESLANYRELGDKAGIAHSLNSLGHVAREQGDYEAARTLYEQSLAMNRELGDKGNIAHLLNDLGLVAHYQGDHALSGTLYEQGLATRRELGDKVGVAHSLYCLGTVAQAQGDYDAARALYEQGLAMNRELGDKAGIAHSLYCLGEAARDQGDYGTARTLYQESLALYRETGHSFIIHVLGAFGHVARELGDYAQATTLYQESLRLRREQGDALATACSLEDFAGLAGRQGQIARAVRLLGAAEAVCQTLGRSLPIGVKEEYERTLAAAHAALSEEEFAATWEEGRAMTWEKAAQYALEGVQG
jgi:predicted ATPase/DNA-binding SARP family transcriptional activator